MKLAVLVATAAAVAAQQGGVRSPVLAVWRWFRGARRAARSAVARPRRRPLSPLPSCSPQLVLNTCGHTAAQQWSLTANKSKLYLTASLAGQVMCA